VKDLKQYLYKIVPTRPGMLTEGPTGEEAAILDQHVAYLGDLTERGVVLLAGRTQNKDESSFGIVIFQVESEEEARRVMEEDPAVRGGIMRAKLYPYRIAFKTG
jgi:uncharacterized protein YciI